jgi:hypothetical protein
MLISFYSSLRALACFLACIHLGSCIPTGDPTISDLESYNDGHHLDKRVPPPTQTDEVAPPAPKPKEKKKIPDWKWEPWGKGTWRGLYKEPEDSGWEKQDIRSVLAVNAYTKLAPLLGNQVNLVAVLWVRSTRTVVVASIPRDDSVNFWLNTYGQRDAPAWWSQVKNRKFYLNDKEVDPKLALKDLYHAEDLALARYESLLPASERMAPGQMYPPSTYISARGRKFKTQDVQGVYQSPCDENQAKRISPACYRVLQRMNVVVV